MSTQKVSLEKMTTSYRNVMNTTEKDELVPILAYVILDRREQECTSTLDRLRKEQSATHRDPLFMRIHEHYGVGITQESRLAAQANIITTAPNLWLSDAGAIGGTHTEIGETA